MCTHITHTELYKIEQEIALIFEPFINVHSKTYTQLLHLNFDRIRS